jgi:hypothetical protein
VPTHSAIRTHGYPPGNSHLKSWLIETSADGESWREVAREKGNRQLNGSFKTRTIPDWLVLLSLPFARASSLLGLTRYTATAHKNYS